MFTARKAAQMAAFFAKRNGGNINILKLIKLLYLADRESISTYGMPISFDNAVSMPHGPVLSRILNLSNGAFAESDQAQWDEWISDKANHFVSLNREFELDDLDQLSEADTDVLELIWHQFGGMDKWQLRDFTHELAEWQDPNGSMNPISDADLVAAVIGEGEEANALAEEIRQARS